MSKPKRKLTDEQVRRLCEDLRGSTGDQEAALKEIDPSLSWDDLTEGDLIEFDMQIFLCVKCGWWCGDDEEAMIEEEDENAYDERICQECYDES